MWAIPTDTSSGLKKKKSQFGLAPRNPIRIRQSGRIGNRGVTDDLHFSSHSSLTLQAYSDADWAGDPIDRRSTTGYCFIWGDSLILGEARNKQSLLIPALK